MQKLSQVIAVEKGIKERTKAAIDGLYHVGQKTEPFSGIDRTYTPKDDNGDRLPKESKLVQQNVTDILKAVRKSVSELLDITAAKDFANCSAKASVVVDGVAILENVPVTFLMFLEKCITDLLAIVGKLPVLPTDQAWTLDANSGLYKSEPEQTLRTAKEVMPLVLYPATDKHPAQTDKITRDVTVGTWTGIKISGAMPAPAKEALLERLRTLQRSVKYAREAANNIEAPEIDAGNKILGWLFAGKEG